MIILRETLHEWPTCRHYRATRFRRQYRSTSPRAKRGHLITRRISFHLIFYPSVDGKNIAHVSKPAAPRIAIYRICMPGHQESPARYLPRFGRGRDLGSMPTPIRRHLFANISPLAMGSMGCTAYHYICIPGPSRVICASLSAVHSRTGPGGLVPRLPLRPFFRHGRINHLPFAPLELPAPTLSGQTTWEFNE